MPREAEGTGFQPIPEYGGGWVPGKDQSAGSLNCLLSTFPPPEALWGGPGLDGWSGRAHREPMPSAARSTTRKSPARRRSNPQTLLVLHFDAEKRRADHLHLGEIAAVTATISGLALGGRTVVEDATTTSDLMSKLARFAEDGMTFDVIVAVGHSSADGIRVASDLFMPWASFAQMLKPLKPRRLLLVACQAGRANAGQALFNGLRELRRIYACPVNASKDFGAAMMFAIPYVVSERRPKAASRVAAHHRQGQPGRGDL